MVIPLRHTGYEQDIRGWRHPERQIIFMVGFIDRGPEQVETDGLMRSTVNCRSPGCYRRLAGDGCALSPTHTDAAMLYRSHCQEAIRRFG